MIRNSSSFIFIFSLIVFPHITASLFWYSVFWFWVFWESQHFWILLKFFFAFYWESQIFFLAFFVLGGIHQRRRFEEMFWSYWHLQETNNVRNLFAKSKANFFIDFRKHDIVMGAFESCFLVRENFWHFFYSPII